MKIVLCCSAGMSTSMVVREMKKVAPPDAIVLATGMDSLSMQAKDADVILIAPQLAYSKNQIKELFPDKPVDAIPIRMYGTMDGNAVYNFAVELTRNKT